MKTFLKIASMLAVLVPLILLSGFVLAAPERLLIPAAVAAAVWIIYASVFGRRGLMLSEAGTITMDIFTTRTMLAAIEQMYIPRSFLLDTFFNGIEKSDTEVVDIDIYKGKRRLAPFVAPLSEGKMIDRIGYTTKTFKPPYIKEKMATSAVQIMLRGSGQTIYQGQTPGDRAAAQLGKDMLELIQMIQRREEWMASQILTTGKVRCTGDGIDVQIDFLMPSGHIITLTSTALWSAPTTATPVTNLRSWKRLVSQDSGIVPNVCTMGQDAITNFLKCDEVTKTGQLSNVKIMLGQIDPKQLPNGVTYWGYVEGLDIYSYDEWYVDPADGTEKPMVPVGAVLLGSTNARTARHYGAILDLAALAGADSTIQPVNGPVPAQYFPKSWREEDPSVQMLLMQSSPLPAMHQPDAFLVATVL